MPTVVSLPLNKTLGNMANKSIMKQTRFLLAAMGFILYETGQAQTEQTTPPDSIFSEQELQGVVVKATNGTKSLYRINNTEIIGQSQLIRAACCNLGESFTTNPSVDVSYSDAATGARQIKLLGLSGTYVQLLSENVPNLRGASIPYALGYVPGPCMQSIQVREFDISLTQGVVYFYQ